MNYYLGIDLGTSSVKGVLFDRNGKEIKSHSFTYSVYYPQDGWSEQNPENWLIGVIEIISILSKGHENDIKGLSVAGQMHGLVILDENDEVIRPCILWNDSRTEKETNYLNEVIGKSLLSEETGNIAFAGFTLPKILWLKNNEPENYHKIKKMMLPKDYITYMLTGYFVTDYSDASGMLLLDVKNKRYSKKILNLFNIDEKLLPELHESFDVVGKVKSEYNLPHCVVTAGAGDNAAAAIGTGTISNGDCNISLGTSGTVFVSLDEFKMDDNNALHSFAHANGKYHLMGCILSAASCNKWWFENILGRSDYQIRKFDLGHNKVMFLPYMMGERSPHNDPFARSLFIGMRPDTTQDEMSLAILEGVSFALKDCLEVVRKLGVTIKQVSICGGGAKSDLWCQVLSNILNVDVYKLDNEQGPALGAAILAMVGSKEYPSIEKATDAIVRKHLFTSPNQDLVKLYQDRYLVFKNLYLSLKNTFKEI